MRKGMPLYSKGEEIFNGVSHIVGAGLGIVMLVITIIFAAIKLDGIAVLGSIIYGISIIVLYTMSAIYHMLSPRLEAKKVFRVLDHCTIYFLIAGSYTAIVLIGVRNGYGYAMLSIVWSCAILGIVLNAINMNNKAVKIISMILYVLIGWVVIFFVEPFLQGVPMVSFIFLLLGGIAYTIGSILYGVGKKKKWIHSIFHLFCLLGTILQFVCVMQMIFLC